MKKNFFSRREFLQRSAGATGALVASRSILLDPAKIPSAAAYASPNDKIRFGIIGIGMQGSGLLSTAVALPGTQCIAAADLYDGRHTLAQEIVGAKIMTTRHYKELLDNKDIDCLIAAVPDHWHKQVVVDAMAAGKPIYCEKPMSHTAADGIAMVEAAKKSGKVVQIGSQRVSSVICTKAKELIAKGVIGDLNLIEGSLGRNDPTGAWVYPPPPDLSPTTFDWTAWQGDTTKRPWDPDMSPKYFARWRCWKEYGTGVAGDLLVHLVSGMNYMMGWNAPPNRVMATGGIFRWPDGRNMPDVQAVLYEYTDKNYPVYLRLNLGSESPETYRFYGSRGMLEVMELAINYYPQTGQDSGPSYYTSGYPRDLRDAYLKKWHEEHDPQPMKEPLMEAFSFRGDSWDDQRPHMWNYFDHVRKNEPVVEDAVFGHNAALACHMSNESYFRHSTVVWDAKSGTIKNA